MCAQALIKIKRYSQYSSAESGASRPEKPYWQEFEIEANNGATVLDAIIMLKDTTDASLSFRHSCKMGICGSCGAIVNGKPVLMCQTFIKDLKQPIKIEAMQNFPIIKDLIVDIDEPMNKIRSVMPYTKRLKEKALEEGEYSQSPAQLKKIKQTSQCIKCMLCCSACPVYGFDKEFVGPMASALTSRYMQDSRDEAKKERLDRVTGKKGVWECSFIGECSRVCPKNVDPAMAIQRLKASGALRIAKKIISKK